MIVNRKVETNKIQWIDSKEILFCIFFFLLAVAIHLLACFAFSEPLQRKFTEVPTIDTPRFTLYIDAPQEPSARQGQLINNLTESSLQILNETYEELSRIFDARPSQKVVLRFLSQKDLRSQTGAPQWTSAMYYRGEISIPLSKKTVANFSELRRALRHEYTHAVIAEIAARRCPAWLDEGLAQLIEGPPNPLLGPALRHWIGANDAMPLQWLENGFITLDQKIVPAAYAQSLFSTRSLVNTLGFQAIRKYLVLLQSGETENEAFEHSFLRTKKQFLAGLTKQMKMWARSGVEAP